MIVGYCTVAFRTKRSTPNECKSLRPHRLRLCRVAPADARPPAGRPVHARGGLATAYLARPLDAPSSPTTGKNHALRSHRPAGKKPRRDKTAVRRALAGDGL